MKKLLTQAQDSISFITHFYGAIASLFLTVILVIVAMLHRRTPALLISLVVFGLSSVALYSASALYHYISDNHPNKTRLRKLDHSMIYVLIAGTYTPICMAFLGNKALLFIGVMWAIALFGIISKIVWLQAPRLLYTLLYLAMGWAVLFDLNGFSQMPESCLFLIALGGLSYTVGAVIYILKKPNFSKNWGFHEGFHIFILVGTLFHFIAVLQYIA